MIIMLCGECQSDMFLDHVRYYSNGGNKYRMVYILIDENNHKSKIDGSEKEYIADSAEARLIQSLIDKTSLMETI